MVDSDQNEGEIQEKMPSSEISTDNVSSTQKRAREESSEDEQLPAKKSCISVEESMSENHKPKPSQGVNGAVDSTDEHKDESSMETEEETDSKLVVSAKLKEENEENKSNTKIENVEMKEEDSNFNKDTVVKGNDQAAVKQEVKEEKDSISMELKKGAETESVRENENEEEEIDEEEDKYDLKVTDESQEEKKETSKRSDVIKSQTQEAEVVEGLELSVECASDKDPSSSSDSESEKKPKRKTIIVKAKPNDSELDVSSSEAEKSDAEDTSKDVETPTEQPKARRKKGARMSLNKSQSSGSEEFVDNVSDEDYSPRTKKKMKRAAANKKTQKSTQESKRGRGRGRRATVQKREKSIEKEKEKTTKKEKEKPTDKEKEKLIEKETDEENNDTNVSDKTNDKKKTEEEKDEQEETLAMSGSERSKSEKGSDRDSESESDGENVSKDGKKGRRGTAKPEDSKKIQTLKKYVRAAGIHVKSYNVLWAGCKSNAARERCLQQLLEKHGVTGRPTMEKCKKAKERNERIKETSELNTGNILSEGRMTRARKNMDKDTTKTSETPTKQREARSSFKRILNVVDSDSE